MIGPDMKSNRFTLLPTQQSIFPALDKELEEINDVSDNYQVNDMALDDTVKVNSNEDVNHMEVNTFVRVEESQCEVNETVVEDSGMGEESYYDVSSIERMNDDNYDANYVYEGSGEEEDSELESEDVTLALLRSHYVLI
ncbi:hypothetical protein Tco_1276960 [Tanacetum coccineum]